VTIDIEQESRALLERSRELATMLENAIPTVDKTQIREALAESKRLGTEARKARDTVVERVRKGRDPGVTLGPVAPIRKVPSDRQEAAVYEVTKGRAILTAELVAYWAFQRDVVGPAIVSAYEAAAEQLPLDQTLLATVAGHLALLRQRGIFVDEGREELDTARRHFDACRGRLQEGVNDGRLVSDRAGEVLENLQGEATAAKMQGQGVDFLSPWLAGKVAALLGHEIIDAKSPLGPPKQPAPHPVAGRR
jgi:hypothetical protein